ncbi:MAG: decarboxylating NADP(+)-dependent phosphogluconate dehydrogenase [Candidatus Hodarchaeales archaeon]
MDKKDVGLIGLAVMGQNLTLNIENNGYSVAVYNRTKSKMDTFLQSIGKERNITGFSSLDEFSNSLKTPRKIFLMVKAGNPIDELLAELEKHLDPSDIIIDGGNSYFLDTQRRYGELKRKGYHFMGVGISGGEEGALKGPSIMPGGSREAWENLKALFFKIAAKSGQQPCCSYMGSDGAGHYVKMVHNGIEYADMQLIAEAYFILKKLLHLNPNELTEIFSEWQKGDLDSYLVQITAEIFASIDPETQRPIIDMILDRASQKGTGKWMSQNALDIGVPIPTVSEAVHARYLSTNKEERITASKSLSGPKLQYSGEKKFLIDSVQDALYAAKLCTYAQGFSMLKTASANYDWDLDLAEIATIWREGCIIRAKFLNYIRDAFQDNPDLESLLLDSYFIKKIEKNQQAWRHIVTVAINNGIPCPAFSSALAYLDGYRSAQGPANLIQAQREYFGAHGFERIDKEKNQLFHHRFQ